VKNLEKTMQAFTTLTGTVAPLNRGDVDTDQIIPKQYLKTIHRTGLKEGLFADWRSRPDGSPDPEFFTNQPRYQNASILLTGENFGCGSSREHAPWALLDYGIRSILAPSFADIFYNNCFQNGILPVVLTPQEIQTLFDRTDSQDIYQVTVDLPQQFVLLPEGERYAFTVDPFRKDCMIKGLDGIGLTLQHEAAISSYEARRSKEVPWLFQDQWT
jgi:3-isopropylmalate/(R)-2-methylmalate dehydratase small subunit